VRAQYRIRLALKLAEFRAKHATWKPVRAESNDEPIDRVAGDAS
jgi:hypothetical protein